MSRVTDMLRRPTYTSPNDARTRVMNRMADVTHRPICNTMNDTHGIAIGNSTTGATNNHKKRIEALRRSCM